MQYETVAAAYRDLEQVSSRLALIDRLAELLRQTHDGLLPRVVYLCLGDIAPAFTGIEIGLADKMVTRALADGTGVALEEVRATLLETGDLGLTAEELLAAHGAGRRVSTLEVGVVFETLHQIAAAAGSGSQGRKLELLGGLLERATPLEVRYLARTVTGSLRLGVGHPTVLDALALVHTGSRATRPVLERAYNICSDLGLVAATLVHGGLAAVEAIQVRPGNPVRPMLAQRMSSAAELLAKLGGSCGAEYKYDGVRVQAHRTADGRVDRSACTASTCCQPGGRLPGRGQGMAVDQAQARLPQRAVRHPGPGRGRRPGRPGPAPRPLRCPAAGRLRRRGGPVPDRLQVRHRLLRRRAGHPARPARPPGPPRAGGQPARVDSRMVPDVWFEPALVAEVLGAELTLSPTHTAAWGLLKEDTGLALRFPRFTGRWRDDKSPEDATTVTEVVDLYRSARPTPAGS